MKMIGAVLIVVLLVVLGMGVLTAVALAWSLGVGWLLTLIVPFTWFEASLLTIIASIVAAYIGTYLLQALLQPDEQFKMGSDVSGLFESPIPVSRFYEEGEIHQRAEVWFRHEIANDLFWEFQDTPSIMRFMEETEAKEMAVRLTDIVVGLLKQRTSRARQVKITKKQLVKQMEAIGQRPYDDDILLATVRSVNMSLAANSDLADIVRRASWDETEMDW